MLALRLARRELRGGVRSLWIVLLCLALGVSVIAAVGSLRAATDRGLVEDGRRILGGDLEVLSGSQPLSGALRDWLRARGARLSEVVQMRSMLVAPTGERQLVELKAVDTEWPLVGEATVRHPLPPTPSRVAGGGVVLQNTPSPAEREGVGGRGCADADQIAAALANHGLLAERVVLDRLGLHPGDSVRLGNATFTVRGTLLSEPDRAAAPLLIGPRALISLDALPSTGLIVPGSMVQYAVRATLPDPARMPDHPDRSPARLPRRGLAHSRPARRRPRRDPLHRPDQPVPHAGRPDIAPRRRHRRRQRRPRVARCPRPHHRHAPLPWRSVRPGPRGLPDPGAGPRRVRHRHRPGVRRLRPDRAQRVAERRAAGATRRRHLPWAACACRCLRPAHGARLLALAAWPRRPHPRRRAVPRLVPAGANPARDAAHRHQRRGRPAPDRPHHRHLRRSPASPCGSALPRR